MFLRLLCGLVHGATRLIAFDHGEIHYSPQERTRRETLVENDTHARMTRFELLKILVGQARDNGFEFRRWYVTRLELRWTTADAALTVLAAERRYYALLFAHEFARSFWKAGEPITFQMPEQSFPRTMGDGSVRIVQRKAYMRRSARSDVWRYHLRAMALAAEPLRYIRRFLHVSEELDGVHRPHDPQTATVASPGSITLALARKAHARRQAELELERELEANAKAVAAVATKRKPRLPGQSRKKKLDPQTAS